MTRGGKRNGSGRPIGKVKESDAVIYIRCTEKDKEKANSIGSKRIIELINTEYDKYITEGEV